MSDEEFFMDEEELAEEAKQPKEVETKKKKGKSKRRGVLPETMNFTLAIGLIVCAFAVGFLLRGFFAPTTQSPVTELPTGHPAVRPGVEAPPLTEQQL
ncbi:MAG: hypothetical protein Q8M92_08435, partial [Candidatus Subteraquimicrobiales bacterium]|nr:hypothetical protein [Candidatus Subteraquimicrobiales bacterium]